MKKIVNPLFLLMLLIFTGCKSESKIEKTQLQGAVFGTSYSIIYVDESINYTSEINKLFDEINASLSTYVPTSDISKINAGDSKIEVDIHFENVFKTSKKIHKETNGFFDPTVGILVNAWGFGPKKSIKNLSENKIDSLMQFIGLDKVTLNNKNLTKENNAIYLDFNSVAKGYAVDVVSNFLDDKKIENYLVEIGGEIRAKGKNDRNQFWKVGIDNPNTDGTRTISELVALENESIASSGNYRKFRVDNNGKKFVHTINPKTGLAQESNLLAATVIGNIDCADADAYATAFMAMGLEKAKDFITKKKNLKVIVFYLNDEGNFEKYTNVK